MEKEIALTERLIISIKNSKIKSMKNLINFFIKVGKIKRMKQRGLVFRGVKDPVTVAAHSFREALMGWVLNEAEEIKLNTKKILKIVLLHDLCAGYAGDITPYKPFLPKKRKPKKELFKRWVRFSKKEKEKFFLEKHKREWKAIKELTSELPENLKKEMRNLWSEYERGSTKEGRFIQQLDMLENLFQALEYWKEDKNFPIRPWWDQMKELIDNPLLLNLMEELGKEFRYKKR